MTARLLIATTNRGKQAVVTPDELGLALEVEEPYDTYAENAAVKARAFCRASGLFSLADDSGIEVAALDWGPGVRSARWGSGPGSQADRLGRALVEADDRRARMVCSLALARPDAAEPIVEVFTGVVEGAIAREPRGENGFGYDPIFLLPSGVTTAELPQGEKDRISHRGRAVAAASARLRELLAG